MSVSVAAYAILGVPIDLEDLYTNKTVSVHKECAEGGIGAFCSSCGQLMSAVEVISTPLKGYDPEGGEDHGGTFRGLEIIQAFWGDEARCFLVAAYVKDDSDGYDNDRGPRKLPDFDLDSARTCVRDVLEPIGLWNPHRFGIWVAADYH